MNKLIREIVRYIEDQVRSVVIASSGGGARLEFVGAPTDVLQQVMSHFLNLGGISVDVNGEKRIVPVYLLDGGNVNPKGIESGSCDDGHLTSVRNWCQYFLVLIPPTRLENRSISSSITSIGVPHIAGEKWSQHPLINDFIKAALTAKGCDLEIFKECIDRVLDDAEALDEHQNDRMWQWKILEVLFNIGNTSNEKHNEVIAACGLPRSLAEPNALQSAQHIMDVIAEEMLSEGRSGFFEKLSESVENTFKDQQHLVDPIKLAIQGFRAHLTRWIDNAPEFQAAPRIYYSPYRTCDHTATLPTWWNTLTVDVWEKLLENRGPDHQEEINVKLENSLFTSKKGHPHVVRDIPSFKVERSENGILPEKVFVECGVGRRAMVQTKEIDTSLSTRWEDHSPKTHEKNLRYRFSAINCDQKPKTIQLISLENFVPGVIIDARAARKITVLKKAKGTTTRKAVWECDLTLLGKGMQHHFDIYLSSKVRLINKVRYITSNNGIPIEEHFYSERPGKNQVILDLEEEGHIELTGTMEGTNKEFVIHAQIHLEDIEASEVRSWFEKLIELHCASSSDLTAHRIDLSWSKSQQLAKWILDDKDSYYPLVMGYDFRENWKNPRWDSLPIMSGYAFSNDIRPRKENFLPPDDLLEIRESVRNLVNKEDGVIEQVNLGELAEDSENMAKVTKYVQAYSEWLKNDRDNALWFDTIAIIGPEASGSVLSLHPDAILLNPMHPIRLGWQFLAQSVLYSSLMRQKHCPAAGVLDPCLTPDCMMLPCWTAGQQVHQEHFLSVTSDSDYWGVLWNSTAIDRLSDTTVGTFFDNDFGIKIDGIAAGFTVSQVGRALKDIATIRSARACLKIRLVDDTVGGSSCTDGITTWSSENLGENDGWLYAGPKSLEVYDARSELQWPNTQKIANLTNDTLAAVKWFKGSKEDGDTIDLTIINHLGSTNPALAKHDIPSAIGQGTLIRQRVRRQLPTQTGNQFVSESRKSAPRQQAGNDLSRTIEHLSWQLEDACDNIDSFVFAPKMIKIQESLKKSSYCAVSSTIVDPSCFFDADENAYLWDYDMPAYARRTGNNNGYYLIASETKAILQAVQRNLGKIAPDGHQLPNDTVRSILREISSRGFPTLKRLVTHGATSTGEIGLLAALRVLQNKKLIDKSLFPLSENKYVNLVVPIDPFRDMIGDLKKKLKLGGSRPDILAVSIYYHRHQILIKFTPIEVKHRSNSLMESEKKSALEQASEFSKFMAEMELLAESEQMWNIALTNLLTAMINFGFRATSVSRGMGGSKEWAEIHSVVLQALMSGEAKRKVDGRGRLIIVDQSSSNFLDLDNDGFRETLVLQKTDAFKIITSEDKEIMNKIKDTLQYWDLLAIPNDITKPKPEENIENKKEEAKEIIQITSVPPSVEENPVVETTIQAEEQVHGVTEDEKGLGIYFPVGTDITSPFHDPELYFHPSNTDLLQLNIGVVGNLGTGKTQLTKALIYRFVNSEKENRGIRPKFLIFDYKGDYIDPEFINAVGGRVVKPYRIPLNLFDISSKDHFVTNPIIDVASFFWDIISKIYKIARPIQQDQFTEAIMECYGFLKGGDGLYPTIYDVYNSYKAKINEKADSTSSILSDIVKRELFERDASRVMPFKEFFDSVTVIDLKSLGQNDNTKSMLVIIFLNLFYDHMLQIEKRAFLGKEPQLRVIDSMLVVDEAYSIMKYNFDVLNKILREGREFGVGVLLASQYLSHFRTQQNNYMEPLYTWFIHSVPNIVKKEIESIGYSNIDTDVIERIKSQKKFECLYKSLNYDKHCAFVRGYPFYELIKTASRCSEDDLK